MKNLLLEIIIIIFLICLLILIILQIRKTYNINKVLIDTTNIIENFESTDTSNSPSDKNKVTSCQSYNLKDISDRLDKAEKDIKVNSDFRIQATQKLNSAPN